MKLLESQSVCGSFRRLDHDAIRVRELSRIPDTEILCCVIDADTRRTYKIERIHATRRSTGKGYRTGIPALLQL